MTIAAALIYPVDASRIFAVFLVLGVWLIIIYQVNVDISRWMVRKERNINREFWNTLIIFAGPLGLLIYLLCRAGVTDAIKIPLLRLKIKTGKPRKEKGAKASIPGMEAFVLYDHRGQEFHATGKKTFRGKSRHMDILAEAKELICYAWKMSATDIHLESKAGRVTTRIRIDGILHNSRIYSYRDGRMVLSAIKAAAGMDVAEKRKSLDGNFSAHWGDRQADFRVASSSTIYGETVVMRLLDKSLGLVSMENLGLSPEAAEKIRSIAGFPHGMILVSGPTGSGKTTTVYAMLSEIDASQKNIITIEDPIEYKLEGVTQMPVNPKAGISFANGLRSILRQDPDIILVGEIRDEETMGMAAQAALTGHLVFTTIHANDAVGTLMRMKNMKVESNLISSSVAAIVSQILVRKLCNACKEIAGGIPEVVRERNWEIKGPVYRARGCEACRNTGYKGRTGVFEIMIFSDRVKGIITRDLNLKDIKAAAIEDGMVLLKDDGLEKVIRGITSPEELARVIPA